MSFLPQSSSYQGFLSCCRAETRGSLSRSRSVSFVMTKTNTCADKERKRKEGNELGIFLPNGLSAEGRCCSAPRGPSERCCWLLWIMQDAAMEPAWLSEVKVCTNSFTDHMLDWQHAAWRAYIYSDMLLRLQISRKVELLSTSWFCEASLYYIEATLRDVEMAFYIGYLTQSVALTIHTQGQSRVQYFAQGCFNMRAGIEPWPFQ